MEWRRYGRLASLAWVLAGTALALTAEGAPAPRALALAGRLSGMAFSPDGRTLATIAGDGKVQLWDVASGSTSGPPLEGSWVFKTDFLHAQPGGELAFSPSGESLCWRFRRNAVVWDVATRRPIGTTLAATAPPGAAKIPGEIFEYSPDGAVLLVQAKAGLVLWSAARRGPTGPVLAGLKANQVRFSRDGRRLVSGDGREVRLWDVATSQPVGAALPAGRNFARAIDGRALVFSPDDRWLAGIARHEVVVWELATGRVAGSLRSGKAPGEWAFGTSSAATFRPDGSVLAWITGPEVVLFSVARGEEIGRLPVTARTLAFTPDGRRLAIGDDSFGVSFWDAQTGAAAGPAIVVGFDTPHPRGRNAGVWELQYLQDGATLTVETSLPSAFAVWEVGGSAPRALAHFTPLDALGFAELGRLKILYTNMALAPWGPDAVASSDRRVWAFRAGGALRLVDVARPASRASPAVVPGFDGQVIAFSPDSTTLATLHDRRAGALLTLWDVASLLDGDE